MKKKGLKELRNEYCERLIRLRKELQANTERFADFLDKADQAQEHERINTEVKAAEFEIRRLDNAIEREKQGLADVCIECGVVISLERLEAQPYTTHCVVCKGAEEQQNKLFNHGARKAFA